MSLTHIECPLFKLPRCPQACTEVLPNMEGVVKKTTNSQPKILV
jgi:hypothetical protein